MANSLFFGDGSFRWPRTLESIAAVPDQFRRYYRFEKSRRHFILLAHAEQILGPLRTELDELETKIAEMPAKHEAERAALDRAAIHDALHSALTASGVKNGLVAGAAAIMRDNYALSVLKSGDERHVVAETAYGVFPVDALVEQFLESEDGQPYAGKPVKPEPGHFAKKLLH